MRAGGRAVAGGLLATLLGAAALTGGTVPALAPVVAPDREVAPAGGTGPARPLSLHGRVVVLDAGHQLGNRNFPGQINRPVPAGGFHKPCNTTGTATASGYPEATAAWRITRMVRRALVARGARVVMVRTSNRADRWGPCVDRRGRAGNRIGADLKVSVHADGNLARGAHGFHVIVPTSRRGWTDDIAAPSLGAGRQVRRALDRAGLARSTYLGGRTGLVRRGDLGTLNLSDVPTVMVELGNMREPGDARRLSTRRGQGRYARALVRGILRSLTR